MSFDKEVYAERRRNNLRGQTGPKIGKRGAVFLKRDIKGYPIPAHEGGIPSHQRTLERGYTKPVSKTAIRKKTKRYRKAVARGEM